MNYRPEIDGLRAIAVSSVLLFHAGLPFFSGGFVGVDIFFVISGFLITSILIQEIRSERFSLANFYERRARRILPALIFMVLITVPFALSVMTHDQIRALSESIFSVGLLISNFYFLSQVGYFAPDAEFQPLLHTWSLSIEEQFYLFFPIFLLVLYKKSHRLTIFSILILAFSSILIAQWGLVIQPEKNFFFSFSRFWEIFVGAIMALIISKKELSRNNFVSIIGFIFILSSLTITTESNTFPNLNSVLAVIGSALVILYIERKTFIYKLLSNNFLVFIGLISYSVYLWHQPIFSLVKIQSNEDLSLSLKFVLIFLSFLIGFFSWKFIEKPFRNKTSVNFSRRQIFILSSVGLMSLVLLGIFGSKFQHLFLEKNMKIDELLSYEKYDRTGAYSHGLCFIGENETYKDFSELCLNNDPQGYFVWGDSNAAPLANGIRAFYPNAIQRTASGCPPLLDIEILSPPRPNCREINNSNLEFLKKFKNKTVVLHAHWKLYPIDIVKHLEQTIKVLKSNGINKIIIAGGTPQYKPSLPNILFLKKLYLDKNHIIRVNQDSIRTLDKKIEALSKTYDVDYKNLLVEFCDSDNNCRATVKEGKKYVPITWDDQHMTLEAAKYIGGRIF